MKIFNGIKNYVRQSVSKLDSKLKQKPLVVAFGMFDGLHNGHKKVILEAKDLAKKIDGNVFVLTFDLHPKKLLYPRQDFGIITTTEEKIELLQQMSVDGVIFLYFTSHTAAMSPENFLKNDLINSLGMKVLVVGEDFKFGKDQKGDLVFLEKMSKKYGFILKSVANVKIDSQKISSTSIRQKLQNGDVSSVNLYLGHDYFIRGKVIKGLGLARKAGFPTANIHIPSGKILPNGVFIGMTKINGVKYPSVISVGFRKTLEEKKARLCLETHILDFSREIYDETVEVSFIKNIREQKKFETIDLLFKQVKKDVEVARIYGKNTPSS